MWLVALAASLWGLDGLLRQPVAAVLHPATVVVWEHAFIVLVLCAMVPRALRVWWGLGLRDRAAVVCIGAGASAVATALFTRAFQLSGSTGDYVTPLVLQKLQPLFAMLMAVVLLHERLRPRLAWYVVPALAGAWMLTFADPFEVHVATLTAGVLAVAAAVLWASGTVLGRMVSPAVGPRDLTALRFTFGLPAALVVAFLWDAPLLPGWSNVPSLVLLALVPGLAGLSLYYIGLRRTAATRATLAELAFPLTAAVVGVGFLGARLTWTQWVGLMIVLTSVTLLALRERRPDPLVEVADPAPVLAGQGAG